MQDAAQRFRQREYYTAHLINPDHNTPASAKAAAAAQEYMTKTKRSSSQIRNTDTWKSQTFVYTPETPISSHEKIFKHKPLAGEVTRASYQDSNIFGLPRHEKIVQKTAL